MIYDIQQLKTIEPKRLLSIFAGSDDWDTETQQPNERPYFGEITMYWDKFMVCSQVIIHPMAQGDKDNTLGETVWDIRSVQIDTDANDEIAHNESIPNSLSNAHNYGITASFLGDDISAYENKDEIVDTLCHLYNEQFANRSNWSDLETDYPDGNPLQQNA